MSDHAAPMCKDSTMFAFTIAASIGSQWPDRKLGSPNACGASRKLMERHPFLASRLTSATARSTSHRGTTPIGMNRPG
jgi:hypothetical protein